MKALETILLKTYSVGMYVELSQQKLANVRQYLAHVGTGYFITKKMG